jgi:serine/threonine protein kinase
MPTLSQLGNVLTACKVAGAERWARAAKLGGGDLAKTLDALAAFTPEWWPDGAPGEPPGLTDYQRGVIEHWLEGGTDNVNRQLALNSFLLLDKLGQGGQGAVFRARQLNPGRFVAIKTLTQDTESGRQRFEQEAKAMMKVRHHGVARFYLYERVRDALGKPTDEYLIAMEYAAGTDLYRLLSHLGPLPWRFVARWAIDLLGGLAAIHENGFVHRDVKPANVMVIGPAPGEGVRPSQSAAKLLDFGAVKHAATEGGTGARRVFVGTREYAPPEQWAEQVVPASDLYALGATLFEALVGRPPYEVPDRDVMLFRKAHARAPIPDANAENPDVPVALAHVVTKMLAKKPDERGTPTELIAELQALMPKEDRPEPATEERRPRPAAVTRAPEPEPEPEPISAPEPPDAATGVLAFFERIYLPPRLRPVPGHEPPAGERIVTLLRRPLVLVTLAVLIGLYLLVIF